jgi:hypothetical protein
VNLSVLTISFNLQRSNIICSISNTTYRNTPQAEFASTRRRPARSPHCRQYSTSHSTPIGSQPQVPEDCTEEIQTPFRKPLLCYRVCFGQDVEEQPLLREPRSICDLAITQCYQVARVVESEERCLCERDAGLKLYYVTRSRDGKNAVLTRSHRSAACDHGREYGLCAARGCNLSWVRRQQSRLRRCRLWM